MQSNVSEFKTKDDVRNLRLMHAECNSAKGVTLPGEA